MEELIVEGMMCKHCVARVEKALNAVEGVTSINTDLAAKKVVVEGSASRESLISAVKKAGYDVK